MTPPPLRWQALDSTTLHRRHWPDEDEGVVFNCASGDLHLLNQTALDVLEHLSDSPSTLEELAVRFPIDVTALKSLLESLDSLGLVSPVPL